ncbi:MAG TPA: hypothetical protein VKV05_01140 [Terriglobales bacterium]|nr:hypothetical protein [Terriglobales bacterium]
MKLLLSEAARSLGVHPLNLLLYLGELEGLQFDEIWPDVDESWIQCIKEIHHGEFELRQDLDHSRAAGACLSPDLGDEAMVVIEKLWRHNKWGVARVSIEGMQNITHLGSNELKAAVEQLRDAGLLLSPSEDTYSLNSAKKGEVEALVGRHLSGQGETTVPLP